MRLVYYLFGCFVAYAILLMALVRYWKDGR